MKSSLKHWAAPASVSAAVVLLVTIFLGGCSSPPEKILVTGKVLINDKEADGAYVLLYNEGQATEVAAASARTINDGSFKLEVATPGNYLVTLMWPKKVMDDGALIEGDDRFQGRYRNPQKPVAKIEIHEGENSLDPITLKAR
ncbi:hypothetical protein [Bremerella cremea]|uniref:hypothetical protein n=1 Tax=Bremerella cremea TaxID=1031537 RepID=UPI0031EC0817